MASGPSTQYLEGDLQTCRGNTLIAVAAIFAVLEFVIVVLRIYARKLTRVTTGVDDLMVVMTLFLSLLVCGATIAAVKFGDLGTHLATTLMKPDGAEIFVRFQKFLFSLQVLYSFVIMAAKLSVCQFYLRIFTDHWFRMSVYLLMLLQLAWVAAVIPATIFQCLPLEKQWYMSSKEKCFNLNDFYKYSLLPNIITDIFLMALPLPVIWRLKLKLSQKLGLTFVFLLGSIGFVGSCIRFAIFSRTNFAPIRPTGDSTWESTIHVTWTIIEPGMILIATCLALLGPLTTRFSKYLVTRTNSLIAMANFKSSKQSPPKRPNANTTSEMQLTGFPSLNEPLRRARQEDCTVERDISSRGWAHEGEGREFRWAIDLERGSIPQNTIRIKRDMEWSCSN